VRVIKSELVQFLLKAQIDLSMNVAVFVPPVSRATDLKTRPSAHVKQDDLRAGEGNPQ
jgi:hypothetical protein